MAVTSREELRCRFEGHAIISNSEHSPRASKATVQVETGDVTESNKCKHFTIRGYVAEVRKRDAKTCPFIHRSCTALECADLFPPLCVANFRWWGCHNCVNEIIASATQMTTEGSMCIQSQDMNNNNNSLLESAAETSQQEAIKVFSRLPLISEENRGEDRLTTEYCSINFSKHVKEGNEDPHRNIIKGFRICKDGYDYQGKARHALQEANCASDVQNAAREGEKGASQNSVGRSLSYTYPKQVLSTAIVRNKGSNPQQIGDSKMLGGDSSLTRTKLSLCNTEDVQPESMKAVKKSGIDIRKGHRKSMKIYNMIGKDDVLYADETHTLGHGTSCDMRSCGASFCDTKNMSDSRQIENETENMHSKKIRKVRLLEDIIRNTEQHMAENNRSLAGDGICAEHDLSKRQDAQKRKVLLLNHISDVAPQNTGPRSVRCTSHIQNPLNEYCDEDEAAPHIDQRDHYDPLRNSLKFVGRRNIHEDLSNQGEGPSLMHWLKNMSTKANSDKGDATTQQHKILISNFASDLSVGNDQDLYVKDCDALACTVDPNLRQMQTLVPRDGRSTKNLSRHEEKMSKNYTYKNINTKPTVILDKKHQCRMETSDATGKVAMLHGVRNKRPVSCRGKPYQAKDPLATQTKAASDVWEIESRKPRNLQITESENIDDFPMDIVELLARNQYDRHHLISETNAAINLSEMTKRTKFMNGTSVEQGNLSHQSVQVGNKGFGAWTKFQNNCNMENGQQAYHRSVNEKKKLQIDLNLQYTDPNHRTELCNLDNGGCHQLNLPCKNSFLSSQPCLMNHTGAYENLYSNPHGDMLQNMNCTPLGVKNHAYHNSIPTTQGRNLVDMHHYWGSYPPHNEASNASFMDLANGCHPKFCQADLHRTESTSALNLLRLMDHAAWSGNPQFEGHAGFMETGRCFDDPCNEYESLRYKYGTRRTHSCICPVESVHPIVWRQPRNGCVPFRPLPRIGVLGPLLQKEILNCSNYSTIPNRSSHGFLNTRVDEKVGLCHSIPNTLPWNCNSSIPRCICSEKFVPNRWNFSDDTPCIPRNGINQLGEVCVVNRNPAEFSFLDERNEYMIEMKDRKHKSPSTSECLRRFKKKQRVMKLNDLKGYVIR